MKTTVEKDFSVDSAIDAVWSQLSDPSQVVTCVPGATLTEQVDDANYKGQVKMKIGPVSAKYNGQITIEELNEETHEMRLSGKGMDARGKGSADMVLHTKLAEAASGGTDVDFSMEISITGILAQFGSRLIGDVSNQLADQFIANFRQKLAGEADSGDAAEQGSSLDAGSIVGNVVKDKLSGLFGRGTKDE